MTLRTAFRCDAPSLPCLPVIDASGRKIGDAEFAHRVNPNTGALEFVAPLTWTGVRKYRHADGTTTRELRRPEQVRSASHMRGLRLLSATADHPKLQDGTPVYLDARGGPDVFSADGSALRPAAEFEVGHTGDTITDGALGGYYVPMGRVAITDRLAQERIAAGRTQTSLGYTALLDDAGGTWEGPNGPEPFDVEHILDHEDPRIQQAVADGVVPAVELLVDGELKKVPVIGPNHFAVAIWAGRGELQSEIVDFAAPAIAPRADAAPCVRGRFLTLIADAAPPLADARTQRAAATARVDEFSCSQLAPDLVEILTGASLTGRYEGVCGWQGWIDVVDGPGAGGIAFVAADGLGLWWGKREADGSVMGQPAAFAWHGPASDEGLVRGVVPTEETANPVACPRPRLFSMVRQADESGVSGTGHVLDGVVWRDGKVCAAWDTENAPGSVVVYDSYCDFKAIHVDQHPGNGTILAFDDGGLEPATEAATAAGETWTLSPPDVIVVPVEDAITEHAARQQAPGKFDKFLRFAFPEGPSLILGRKGDGPWQVQSVRFPADDWTPAQAKTWLKATRLVSSKFEAADAVDADNLAADSTVTFVAPSESATYAHPVRGNVADARLPTMRKITIPARFLDAATAVAAAVKAPAPAKVADAMLEVELPEGADPAMLAAGMHALAEGVAKMSATMGAMEASAESMGSDFAAAVNELADLKTKIDALTADAEIGRAHRLEKVVAIAKKAGLTDSDVSGKDADAVRAAAVAKKHPGAAKHLDSKVVLDSLWDALTDAVNAPAPVPTPAPVVQPAPVVVAEPIKPAPAPRADNDGNVVGVTARPAPTLSTHRFA